MAIRHAPAPDGHQRALARGLERVVMTPTGSQFLGWRYESPPRPRGIDPHPVYYIGRDSIIAGRLLEDATEPRAWRSLIQLEGEDLYAMELGTADAAEGPGREVEELPLLSVSKGTQGRATYETIESVAGPEGSETPSGELRVIKIPALHFMAVWVHGDDTDAILPIEDHPAGLNAREPYTSDDVVGRLQTYAAAQVQAEEGGRDGAEEMN